MYCTCGRIDNKADFDFENSLWSTRSGVWTHEDNHSLDLKSNTLTTRPSWLLFQTFFSQPVSRVAGCTHLIHKLQIRKPFSWISSKPASLYTAKAISVPSTKHNGKSSAPCHSVCLSLCPVFTAAFLYQFTCSVSTPFASLISLSVCCFSI